MFKRLLAAYRRITQATTRANLDVVPLESRVTPALTPEGLAIPAMPSPVVQIAYTHEAYVRTDLFGTGIAPQPEQAADVWCDAVPEHDEATALLPIPHEALPESAPPDEAALLVNTEVDS